MARWHDMWLYKYLFSYHIWICYLFVVNQVDAKCILKFRQRVQRHILLALQYFRHILLSAVHALSQGFLGKAL